MASAQKIFDEWEASLFVLADYLKIPVYQIREEMPLYELIGWCRYLQNRQVANEKQEAKDILKAFGLKQ